MQKKGNDRFLISSVIAAYDHISLFGSHNTQLAHRGLKPLSFLHCFATSTLIIHTIIHYSLSRKQKQALSSFGCPSLITAPWSWGTKKKKKNLSLPHSVWKPLRQFPLLSSSHISFSDDVLQALQETEIIFSQVLWRVRGSFYPAVVQCSLKPNKGKETKNMFAKIKLKPSSDGVAAIYAHMGCLPRMFLM